MLGSEYGTPVQVVNLVYVLTQVAAGGDLNNFYFRMVE
jgi:hypothetical protein